MVWLIAESRLVHSGFWGGLKRTTHSSHTPLMLIAAAYTILLTSKASQSSDAAPHCVALSIRAAAKPD